MLLFHEGKKLKTLVRLTSHNILGNRESVANSQPFAQRIGRRPTSSCKNSLMSSGACMPSDSFSLNARAPLRLAAFGGKNYNGSRRVEKPRARPMAYDWRSESISGRKTIGSLELRAIDFGIGHNFHSTGRLVTRPKMHTKPPLQHVADDSLR